MNFRTIIDPSPSSDRITYHTPVMLVGSCFSGEMGAMFKKGKMNVLVNPFGVLYNPVSVATELQSIIDRRQITPDDLRFFDNRYLSFDHGTGFSSTDPALCAGKINSETIRANDFLADTDYLFITFGTARIFRLKDGGRVVANCHKIPASEFTRELLSVEQITTLWSDLIQRLKKFNPKLKIYFTVSPVRHWKDGAHGNQVSKAILLLAIENLIHDHDHLKYFPSYELLLDDLRDYRYYMDDLLHPSDKAVEYIWDYLQGTFFDSETKSLHAEASRVVAAMNHKLMGSIDHDHHRFSLAMIDRINDLRRGYPFLNLDMELDYFISVRDRFKN